MANCVWAPSNLAQSGDMLHKNAVLRSYTRLHVSFMYEREQQPFTTKGQWAKLFLSEEASGMAKMLRRQRPRRRWGFSFCGWV